MEDDFRLSDSTAHGVAIVTVHGAMGLPEALALERRLRSVLERSDRMILDLSPVTEVMGGLVGALLRTRRRMARVGAEMTVVVGGRPVSTVIATSILDELLDVVADVQLALERMGRVTAGPV